MYYILGELKKYKILLGISKAHKVIVAQFVIVTTLDQINVLKY